MGFDHGSGSGLSQLDWSVPWLKEVKMTKIPPAVWSKWYWYLPRQRRVRLLEPSTPPYSPASHLSSSSLVGKDRCSVSPRVRISTAGIKPLSLKKATHGRKRRAIIHFGGTGKPHKTIVPFLQVTPQRRRVGFERPGWLLDTTVSWDGPLSSGACTTL